MIKKCLSCNKKKEMRSNQKYCNKRCKKNYENSQVRALDRPLVSNSKDRNDYADLPLETPSSNKSICPTYLNETAAEYWVKIAPTVIERGHLNVLSEDAFAELCDLYSRLRDTNKAIDETNRSLLQIDDTWNNKEGTETQSFKESALSKNKRLYSKLFLDYQKQFYLIPFSNRGNFGLEDKEDVDPHDAFLGMGNK